MRLWVLPWLLLASLLTGLVGGGVAAWAAEPLPLRVGYLADDLPYTHRNAAGVPEGVGIALVQAVLSKAGLQLAALVPVTETEGQAALASGQIDLLLGAVPPVASAVDPPLLPVGPYVRSPVAIVTAERFSASGLASLAGRRVAVPRDLAAGLARVMPAVMAGLPAAQALQTVPVDDALQALVLLEQGQVDAALGGLHGVAERLRKRQFGTLRITGVAEGLQDARHLLVAGTQVPLSERLAEALGPVLQREMPTIEATWAARRGQPGVDWEVARRWVGVGALVVLTLLGALFVHTRAVKREQHRAAQAQDQLNQLLGFLAHQVRSALQSTVGAVALWRHQSPAMPWTAAQTRTLMEAVAESAAGAVGQLDGLLDQHRLQAGTLGLQRRPEPLLEVLREAVAEAQAAARIQGGGEVRLVLHDGKDPGWWWVDAFRLQQVLRNLVAHALRTMPQAGVTVSVAMQPSPRGAGWGLLALQLLEPATRLDEPARRRLFDVDDAGDTIPADAAPQASGERGLRLARDLAQAMGGTLVVDAPRQGEGLCFLLHLNLQEASPPLPAPGPALRRVLVIQDAPAYGLLLVHGLSEVGVQAVLVQSMAAAEQAAMAPAQPFDLVLCDSRLSDGGLADWLNLGWMRRGQGLPVPPVIGLSADYDTAEIHQLSDLGALDLLAKDSDVASVVHHVLRAWASHSAVAGAGGGAGGADVSSAMPIASPTAVMKPAEATSAPGAL